MNSTSNLKNNKPSVVRVATKRDAVIALLCLTAILAVVVARPRFGSGAGVARLTAARAQIAVLGTALGAFEVDNGFYPPGTNGLLYLTQAPAGAAQWRGPYIEPSVPRDPWGHAFIYECPGRHNPQSYDLSSMGPAGAVAACNWKQQ